MSENVVYVDGQPFVRVAAITNTDERPNGLVYFVEAVGLLAVKIGWTSGSPEKRIKALQNASPVELRLIATFDGTIQDERAVHRKFERIRGEWFRFTDDLRTYIWRRTGR